MNLDLCRLAEDGSEMPMCHCLVCGYEFNCASRPGLADEDRPRPGDFSLCLKCGEIYVFQEDMTIRTPNLQEMVDMGEELQQQLETIQIKIRKERPLGL